MHAGYFKALLFWKQEKAINILLPKLHHCTGEIGGVCNGVVCVTFLCVPWIVTWAPWKFLQKQKLQWFFPPLFDTFRDFTGYNSSLTDMTTLTLCWFGLFMNHVSTWRNTYSGEWVVQVVNGPSNDYNVVNVKPEGQDSCCKAHTYHTEMK